ncbi:signal transduction histidine kinase [Haloactinopolyspora alba]|uniref:histidine kinase n=1 Tax=Haloactinopolyspora alba TaxID=648780 RepID=A0A2P8E521_9ACTN|nr:HAMP domain-containing sensor histidine kinase [Haloactinopolyspora alba]PSL04574.1 signal transduction histidine kinase [Haloactinopolyspora alba]
MTRLWGSLRVRLALLGFLASYVPALLLFGVVLATDVDTRVEERDGAVVTHETTAERSPWLIGTVLALAPVAAAGAWWWAGRAVRPIERVRSVAEEIEGSDLGRRIALDRAPREVLALAASFDSMLDRLEESQRIQQRLIEETSHDLRVPLSVLTSNAEVMLAHPSPTVDVYRAGLQRSRKAAERMRATLDELLADARGRARALHRRPADLMDVVREVTEQAAAVAAARDVEIAVSGPSPAPSSVDTATVRRAVANLVDNAVRHAPGGSAVRVDVEVTAADAVIAVTDHGPGIPAGEQADVFARFWSGERETAGHDSAGTGLGLPIARQVAEAHGGWLTLSSPGPDGDGCVFRLSLHH